MITSLFQHGNQLYSLSNTNQLSIHDVSEFITLPYTEMPKIESPLGISLREPMASFELQQLTSESKFVKYESKHHPNELNSMEDILLIYDNRTVIALDMIKLVSKTLSVSVLFSLNEKNFLEFNEEIVNVYCYQETVQFIEHQQQSVETKLIITTTHGRIVSFTMLLSKQQEQQQQNNSKINLQPSLQTNLPTIYKQLNNLLSNNNEQTSTMMEDEKDKNSNLLTTMYGQQQQQNLEGEKLNDKEYVAAIGFHKDQIYCATTTSRLIVLNKLSLEPVVEYETKEPINELYNNNNNNNKQQQQNILNSSEHTTYNPIKIIFERNSLLLLNSKHLLEFNTHTHTLTNSISLPFSTLDITAQHHPKTQATNFIMVGECNAFYTMPYPWTNSKEKYSMFKRVNISSKLAKSVLQTTNNYLFVGGSDGTIDVYKNANMNLMVLLLKSE